MGDYERIYPVAEEDKSYYGEPYEDFMAVSLAYMQKFTGTVKKERVRSSTYEYYSNLVHNYTTTINVNE